MEVCEEGVFPQSEAIKLGFPSPSQPDVESLAESIQNLELSENEKFEWESGSDKGEAIQIPHFPLRPGEPDCAFYLRTGNCKYGPACRFNHPTRYKSWERSDSQESVKEKEKTHERKEYPEKTSVIACKYYLTSGGCKYGKACRFSHPREGYGEEEVELNFLGLPIRPGEKECTFYMRNGSCKFATNCRFHHPDPTAVGGSVSPTRYENDRSFPLQSPVAQWPTNEPLSPYLDASPPYVPVMVSPPHGIPQNPEWNGYRANPMLPHEWSIQSGAAAVSNMNGATSSVEQMTILEEFPQRPGELECQYYMKTGKCKYRSACRFHHPKIRNQKSLPCILSPLGLPLRPDQIICNHYSKYGICKYGPSCRFDHPIIPGSSSSSSAASLSGEPPLWDNPVTSIEEATRPVEAPVQLSV